MNRKRNTRAAKQRGVIIVGERVLLRKPKVGDLHEFVALRRASRSFLERWEPRPPRGVNRFAASGFHRTLNVARERNRCITLVCLCETGQIIGMLNLNEIVRGAFQSATMGYWISRDFARRGLMTEAVTLMLRHAFERLKLHRVEANMIPRNTPSRSLAKAVGMRYEGTAKRYLQINGKWEDHERWAMTVEEWSRK